MLAEANVVGRLRIRGADNERLTSYLRAAQVLNVVELRPRDLPPAAILCVRTLRDPLPGTISLRSAPVESTTAAVRGWERAVCARMDDMLRNAVRPFGRLVPDSAEAVLFTDMSELLACLALAWLRGRLGTEWWWQHLPHPSSGRQGVLDTWLVQPDCVPAALRLLNSQAAAVTFLAALSSAEVEALTRSVLQRFGLHALDARPAGPRTPALTRERVHPGRLRAHLPRQIHLAPWHDLVQSEVHRVSVERQFLLGLSLCLAIQPARVRTQAFAGQVRRWFAARRTPTTALILTAAAVRGSVRRPESGAAELAEPTTRQGVPRATTTLPVHELTTLPRLRNIEGGTPPGAGFSAGSPPLTPDAIGTASTLSHATARNAVVGAEPERTNSPRPSGTGADVAADHRLDFATELGGVLFLVNVALSLELYTSFTDPTGANLDLPIWDFLALVAERLLDGDAADDPLWSLLAQLSGRVTERPGIGFAAPRTWRAPDEWRDVFDSTSWFSRMDRGRLRTWHSAGFWLLDVPGGTLSKTESAAPSAVPRPRNGRLARWVDWWTTYLRARLAVALDRPGGEVGDVLFRHRARVHVCAARLDVVFQLDDVFAADTAGLAIRLAGLDRDPGWVPAAGRVIAFHFT